MIVIGREGERSWEFWARVIMMCGIRFELLSEDKVNKKHEHGMISNGMEMEFVHAGRQVNADLQRRKPLLLKALLVGI